MIDSTTPDSPGWWLRRLLSKLGGSVDRYNSLDTYYRGENGIPVSAHKAVRDGYQRLMGMARTNYAELVVEAVRERLQPVGFRTGASDDASGDREAWRIWQANSLDADHSLVSTSQLSLSASFVIVGGIDDEIGAPLITPEDPREVTVELDPRRRRRVLRALKAWRDDVSGDDVAVLYGPGWVVRARRTPQFGEQFSYDISGWEWDGDIQRLPVNAVPVVPFINKPSARAGEARGEFENHTALLDRINYGVLNRLEIATLQAFRQRAVKGVPTHDAEGNAVDYSDIFSMEPGAIWHLPESAELWESGQVDLGPVRLAIRDDVQDLAAVTRTPLFYLTPEAANGSAEGAALAREGLVFKCWDRIAQQSESWERVMALAFAFAGDELRARRVDMETMWASPERFSLAERYDAAAKAQAAGVPWRSVMADVLQFSPQQIDRMEAERATDSLLLAPPVPNGI